MGETNEFSDHNIIDTFCDFFQQHGRFPGSQDLVVVPKPEIPYFIKTNTVISTNQFYEKFSSTAARGLVSIQALAYYSGSTEISRQALSEFLHNMSHQALNKDNYNVFMQFDRTAELINEFIFMLLDKNNRSLNIANAINNNINNETILIILIMMFQLKLKFKKIWKTYLKTKKSHQLHLLPMFHYHC